MPLKKKLKTNSESVKIAVILPSRGLLFSETFEELLRELKPFEYHIYFAHQLPLPDAFNVPLEKALNQPKWTHILFCEDDMAIPRGILKKMVSLEVPATALDYPFKEDGEATILHDPEGQALYSGTGFLLVMRWILDAMPKPVFTTDIAWDSRIKGKRLVFWPRDVSKIKTYGLHDVNFGLTLWSNGLGIIPAAPAGQRKLVKLGEPGTNHGQHEIKILNKVLKDNITKTTIESQRMKWLARLSEVDSVQIMDHTPPDITYQNGQAVPRKGKFEVI
jgi:hypothetical protein